MIVTEDIVTMRCRACRQDKPEDEFYWNSGKITRRSVCKPCYIEQVKERQRNGPANPRVEPEPTGVTKRCRKCHKVQDTSKFSPDNTKSDGLHSNCRTCRAKAQKRYRERGRR